MKEKIMLSPRVFNQKRRLERYFEKVEKHFEMIDINFGLELEDFLIDTERLAKAAGNLAMMVCADARVEKID